MNARILLLATTAVISASSTLQAADAFYICSGNDNAPLRRNGDGDRGISFEILNNASYTQPSGIGIDTVGKKAYYSRTSSIYANDLHGSNPVLVRNFGTTQFTPVRHVEVDSAGEKIYLTIDAGDYARGIYSMNYDGSEVTPIVTEASLDYSLGIDHDPRLTSHTGDGFFLDADHGRLFWASANNLFTASLSGTGATYLSTFHINAGRINVDGDHGKVYYSNGTTTIYRTNLDGTLLETIYAPGFGYPEALTIDADNNRLYFLHNRELKYTSLDGSAGVTSLGPWGWERGSDMEIGPMPDLSKPVLNVSKVLDGGGALKLRASFNSDRGIDYTIYESLDLDTWTNTGATLIGNGHTLHKDIPFSVSRKFYRVKRESPID